MLFASTPAFVPVAVISTPNHLYHKPVESFCLILSDQFYIVNVTNIKGMLQFIH